jgi:hypothetical protein
MCTAAFSNLNPNDKVTTGKDRPSESVNVRAQDVPLGIGLADTAKRSILTRRERLRIAVEGS